ncbi:MAG: hypothetical protein ACE5F7_03610 [Nitrospiria bacterium]
MGLKNPFKLERLKIKAYKSGRRAGSPVGTFEAMFNPASFKQKYAIAYGKNQGINSTGRAVNYSRSEPSDLNIKLILDGTGVTDYGVVSLFKPKKVSEQVKSFLDLTFHMNGTIHKPNYLTVEWGDLNFPCRLLSADITYTTFDRNGSPLRAELDVKLISDDETEKRMKKENKSSPDLTHRRVVKSGDTLPLMTKEIYGTSSHYLRVAQVNDLNNFRNLSPGQEIVFPPLETS